MKELYYKPSNKFSPSFFLYFILLQIIAIPILSVIYIYLIHYIPFVYLNFFITVGCGYLMGYIVSLAIKLGKVRNYILAIGFTIIAIVIMKYVQWCIYIPLAYRYSFSETIEMFFELLINPNLVFENIKYINNVGVWSFRDIKVTGISLLIVWIVEFCIMLFFAYAHSENTVLTPFSEEDGKWCVQMPNIIEKNLPEDFGTIKKAMEKNDFNKLVEYVNESNDNNNNFLLLTFYKAPTVEEYYLKIEKVTTEQNKKGKVTKKEETLIEYIAIASRYVKQII